jgi:hypothetical protein
MACSHVPAHELKSLLYGSEEGTGEQGVFITQALKVAGFGGEKLTRPVQ